LFFPLFGFCPGSLPNQIVFKKGFLHPRRMGLFPSALFVPLAPYRNPPPLFWNPTKTLSGKMRATLSPKACATLPSTFPSLPSPVSTPPLAICAEPLPLPPLLYLPELSDETVIIFLVAKILYLFDGVLSPAFSPPRIFSFSLWWRLTAFSFPSPARSCIGMCSSTSAVALRASSLFPLLHNLSPLSPPSLFLEPVVLLNGDCLMGYPLYAVVRLGESLDPFPVMFFLFRLLLYSVFERLRKLTQFALLSFPFKHVKVSLPPLDESPKSGRFCNPIASSLPLCTLFFPDSPQVESSPLTPASDRIPSP